MSNVPTTQNLMRTRYVKVLICPYMYIQGTYIVYIWVCHWTWKVFQACSDKAYNL